MLLRIAILGTYIEDRLPRKTVKIALENSAKYLNIDIIPQWIADNDINLNEIAEYDGIFIAPGGAIEEYDSILKAIKFVRENKIPCIGTCGGFQRILTEYAINVLGEKSVLHEECDPNATDPLFSKLHCSISSKKSEVYIDKNSLLLKKFSSNTIEESFYCNYGLNQKYVKKFIENGVKVSGVDENGSARIVEIEKHPFMVGTLFVPQVNSTSLNPHILITEFLKEALRYKEKKLAC